MITAEELFERCHELAMTTTPSPHDNRRMHETLVLACAEGVRDTGMGFGNVFSQVDYLCKRYGISVTDRQAIQTMRRHSNCTEALSKEALLYDLRALCLLISAVFQTTIPSTLVPLLPTENKPLHHTPQVNSRYLRCIVRSWDDTFICVTVDEDNSEWRVDITHTAEGVDLSYLRPLLWEGMQLNLLDAHVEGSTITPQLVVVEPDFLVDISTIAACFTDYGHHPVAYLINQLRERANSQAILLGNFAGSALDDMINHEEMPVNTTIMNAFQQQALQFCTCPGFHAQQFLNDAREQVAHLKEVVDVLFKEYEKEKAILEPSFVCERLGLQGRVDLMTSDGRLLVEQKSGRNIKLECSRGTDTMAYREDHYVQLLLYYGVLRYNFGLGSQQTDIRLLYSRYPVREGLLVVNFYQQLFREAISFRNQLVAQQYAICREGFAPLLASLSPETLLTTGHEDHFFQQYIRPQTEAVTAPLHHLSPLEHAYFTRMMTFVYREQLLAKVGKQEGQGGSVADLWNMPLHEKIETGNIFLDLTMTDRRQSTDYSGYDTLVLRLPPQEMLPNFRRGDMVYLYDYPADAVPDVRKRILYKGTLQEITPDSVTIHLNDGQQNASFFAFDKHWAIEHGASDLSTNSAVRSLHHLMTAPQPRKALLLGQRPPQTDPSRTLSHSYHASYDEILLKIRQSQDYFLLVGPPGTGKTSMALRFMVEEELQSTPDASLLLMSYTNRAVDEICGMLVDAGIDFLRLGNASSCDPRFRHWLIDEAIQSQPKLSLIRQRILQTPVIVGTTSMIQSKPFLFDLKHFTMAIIDEASQILEPSLVGILAAHRQGTCCIDRFVLIGDYKQLPAVVQQDEADTRVDDPLLLEIGVSDCRMSLFERLIRWEEHHHRSDCMGILRRQGRMHPEIAAFPNEKFYFREQLEPVPCEHQLETSLSYRAPSQDALDDLLKARRVIFFPSAPNASLTSDKVNADEARIVALMLSRIYRFYGERFDADKTVGVIVPYRNQIAMIRNEMAKYDIPVLQQISIDTVERYQGSQRDVIIYSLTVQHLYQLDFLTGNTLVEDGRVIDRKLNVAMTRARKQLLMVGNTSVLSSHPLYEELIKRYL